MSSAPTSAAQDTTGPGSASDVPLRVIFMVTVPEDRTERFLAAYDGISRRVAEVDGHVEDQVAQSTTDPTRWVITSLWETAAAFEVWERSTEHRTLVAPMRECFADPVSLRFAVRRQTR
ncbi:antibiotic biosynthesis monooxygenase family protein [Streptomyces sp. NPDC003036]|uniref:antibiotic biosynthesis monooxygenase family protein n=1 Tax=Streptomyces sp. NPDC003036 TaxID=3154442 RepID=UPI0033B761B3